MSIIAIENFFAIWQIFYLFDYLGIDADDKAGTAEMIPDIKSDELPYRDSFELIGLKRRRGG